MRRWVRVTAASAVLAGALAVIPVTASSASSAAAGDAGLFLFTPAQVPMLVAWLAVGVAGVLAAIIALSVARHRARLAVSTATARRRVADAAVSAA